MNMETNEERHIYQMQYIAWPDHGVPEDSSDFLDFVIRVRQVSKVYVRCPLFPGHYMEGLMSAHLFHSMFNGV